MCDDDNRLHNNGYLDCDALQFGSDGSLYHTCADLSEGNANVCDNSSASTSFHSLPFVVASDGQSWHTAFENNPEDGPNCPGTPDVSSPLTNKLKQRSNSREHGAQSKDISQSQEGRIETKCKCFNLWKRWKSRAEPKSSWFLLICTIIPINAILGMNFIGFSIYYVAYAEHFVGASRSSIGVIAAIKETLMCIFGVGCSLCVLSPNYLLHQSFSTNRALAGGLGMIGTTLGNVFGVSLIDYFINTYGWRGSLLLQSGIAANIIPLGFLMALPDLHRTRAEKLKSKQQDVHTAHCTERSTKMRTCADIRLFIKETLDFRLLKNVIFLLVSLGSMLDRFNTFTFMSHMPSRAVYLGLTRTDGAQIVSACTMSILVFRIAVTLLSNLKCSNRVILYAAGGFVGGISSFLLVLLSGYQGQIIASIVVGLHVGMTNTLTWVMLVDLMTMKKFARAMALHDLFVGVAAFSAAPFGGYLYDKTGSYDPPFISSGSMNIVGGTLIMAGAILDLYRRKKGKLQSNTPEVHVTE